MQKSTKLLLAGVVLLNTIIVIWGLLEPSQRDLRMPFWMILMVLIGALADRFVSKRI